MTVLLVAAGAAFGAPVRWWVDRWVQQRWAPVLPWGTLSVNVIGSFVLGVLLGALPDQQNLLLLVGVGFCGALTTFSSFAWETYRLVDDGASALAFLNTALSLIVCVTATAVGYWFIG